MVWFGATPLLQAHRGCLAKFLIGKVVLRSKKRWHKSRRGKPNAGLLFVLSHGRVSLRAQFYPTFLCQYGCKAILI